MPVEFVSITFSVARKVYVDGNHSGATNEIIQVQTGTHTFDLGDPADYNPSEHTVSVTGTLATQPLVIVFKCA